MNAPASPPRWQRLHRLCLFVVITGLLLHVTVRDVIPFPVASLFYALPRPVLAGFAILAAITAPSILQRRICAGLGMLCVAWVLMQDVAWHSPPEPQQDAPRAVFWNVGRDLVDDVQVVDQLLAEQPLVLGLVETGLLADDWLTRWKTQHPEFEIHAQHPGLLLAIRGKMLDQGSVPLPNNAHLFWIQAEIDGHPLTVAVVDIAANPWISRREPLAELSAWLAARSETPVMLMGDFNTPIESAWMSPLRDNYREASLTAGSGYLPTWPWPVPVLKLDQIWLNRHVEVRRAWQAGTWHSDHRIQGLEFQWVTPAASSPR